MNILLVDDDQPAFRTLRGLIENHYRAKGIRLYYESSIPAGLKAAKEDPTIKLVLLDLGMPCVDGPKDALTFVSKFPCSVAIYSAHADPEMVSAATDAGAVSFISKFDRPEDQLACIDEIVQSVRAAHVRMKTEESEGYTMIPTIRRRPAVPIIVGLTGAIVAFVTFSLGEIKGAWTTAKEAGKTEQKVTDRFEQDRERLARFENELLILKADRVDAEKWRNRMEKNILLLLRANKVDPSRDGE